VIRPQQWIESREQERAPRGGRRAAMSSIANETISSDLIIHHEGVRNADSIIMSAVVGDVMHLHQALMQPDREEFLKAMVQEISTHQKRKHWKVVPIEEVPKNTKILDLVWAMRRKRKIGTGEISKYKARLNAHGGQQVFGINYWETYAPVVMWMTIRLIITLAKVNGWYSRQLDFVLAYLVSESVTVQILKA